MALTNSEGSMAESAELLDEAVSVVAGRTVRALPALSFTTESGRAIMGRHFGEVVQHERADRLRVPVPEALLAAAESVKGPVLATVGTDLRWTQRRLGEPRLSGWRA